MCARLYSISKVHTFTRTASFGVVRLRRGWVNPPTAALSQRDAEYAPLVSARCSSVPRRAWCSWGPRVLPSRSPFGLRSLGGPSSPGPVLGRSGPWQVRSSGPDGPLSMESTVHCLLTFALYHIPGRLSRTLFTGLRFTNQQTILSGLALIIPCLRPGVKP